MWVHDLWTVDPLPVPPAPYGSVAWWRWWSAQVLSARKDEAK